MNVLAIACLASSRQPLLFSSSCCCLEASSPLLAFATEAMLISRACHSQPSIGGFMHHCRAVFTIDMGTFLVTPLLFPSATTEVQHFHHEPNRKTNLESRLGAAFHKTQNSKVRPDTGPKVNQDIEIGTTNTKGSTFLPATQRDLNLRTPHSLSMTNTPSTVVHDRVPVQPVQTATLRANLTSPPCCTMRPRFRGSVASLRKQRAMRSLVAGLASSAIFLRDTTQPASVRAWDLQQPRRQKK